MALSKQYEMRTAGIDGMNSLGWVEAAQGNFTVGIAKMRAGIDDYNAMNHRMFQPSRLGLLLEAQVRAQAFMQQPQLWTRPLRSLHRPANLPGTPTSTGSRANCCTPHLHRRLR